MFERGRCSEGHGARAFLGAAGKARAPQASGDYAPRGSCPASSGRQSASGKSGPVGRTMGGSGAGTNLGRLPRPLQGAAPWPGRGAPARGERANPRSPQKQSWERRQRLSSESRQSGQVGGARLASGPGPRLAATGEGKRGRLAAPPQQGSARAPRVGPRTGRELRGPKATAETPAAGAKSTTASPGFCPEARGASGSPTPGVEESGKGAGKGRGVRGHEPGAAPGLAPPAGRGSRPGPAQGGGAAGRGPGPRGRGHGSRPLGGSGREREAAAQRGGQRGLLKPRGCPVGASAPPAGCLPSPWSNANVAIVQPNARHFRRHGAGAGCGSTVEGGLSRARCPLRALSLRRACHSSGDWGGAPRERAGRCRPEPLRLPFQAPPSGLQRIGGAPPPATVSPRLPGRWALRRCGERRVCKLSARKPGNFHFSHLAHHGMRGSFANSTCYKSDQSNTK